MFPIHSVLPALSYSETALSVGQTHDIYVSFIITAIVTLVIGISFVWFVLKS